MNTSKLLTTNIVLIKINRIHIIYVFYILNQYYEQLMLVVRQSLNFL